MTGNKEGKEGHEIAGHHHFTSETPEHPLSIHLNTLELW